MPFIPGVDDRWAGVPPRLDGLVLIGVAGQVRLFGSHANPGRSVHAAR